jgi:hypothetical protein
MPVEDDMADDRQTEIDRNLEFFLKELPNLLPVHGGKYALLRHQQIIAYFDTIADALSAGNSQFEDKLFSVQQVTDAATNLGFYSHAMHLGAA